MMMATMLSGLYVCMRLLWSLPLLLVDRLGVCPDTLTYIIIGHCIL
jgi:hypothetical protein